MDNMKLRGVLVGLCLLDFKDDDEALLKKLDEEEKEIEDFIWSEKLEEWSNYHAAYEADDYVDFSQEELDAMRDEAYKED